MANPRKLIDHKGQGYRAFTFLVDGSTIAAYSAAVADGSASAGLAVSMVAGTEDMVQLTAAGDDVLGKLIDVAADGGCTVQVEGVCELAQGNAVTLIRSGKIIGALGAASARGYIGPVTAPAGSYAQAEAVAATKARHRVLKIADPTKAQVHLGV